MPIPLNAVSIMATTTIWPKDVRHWKTKSKSLFKLSTSADSSRPRPLHTDHPRGISIPPKQKFDRHRRGDSHRRDDNQHMARQRRSESSVRRTRPRSESPERGNRTRQRVQEVINTIVGSVSLSVLEREVNYIAGGFAGGGCSNSARKKHLKAIQLVHSTSTQKWPRIPPITFTDDDFTTIDPTQDDPMVITVEIDKFAITKVLIDQGSLVDILYWRTFQKNEDPISRYSALWRTDRWILRRAGGYQRMYRFIYYVWRQEVS